MPSLSTSIALARLQCKRCQLHPSERDYATSTTKAPQQCQQAELSVHCKTFLPELLGKVAHDCWSFTRTEIVAGKKGQLHE
jgi:hypothetical protein